MVNRSDDCEAGCEDGSDVGSVWLITAPNEDNEIAPNNSPAMMLFMLFSFDTIRV